VHLLAALVLAQTLTVNIDAAADRHRIDPRVYGLNFATQAQLEELNVPLNRSGGNATTRYNWQLNASNRAFDWYYESLEEGSATPGDEVDQFVGSTLNAKAAPMVTIPIIGWVAKLGPDRERLSSYSIAKYGPQQDADWQWFPDAGNGVRTNGTPITNNDPNDANTPADPAFQRGWVQHLLGTWGGAGRGGVRYYILDNEYSIWQSTHRDVQKTGATMGDVISKTIAYSEMIKDVDPRAIVVGPEEWGWTGYFLSGYDQQWAAAHDQWWDTPDRLANEGMDYLPRILQKLHEHDVATGHRTIDVFTVHYYPQSGEYSEDTSEWMQLMRNRSTRALWDPGYFDEAWIGTEVRLISRMREWTSQYYPGMPIGITEYSWGADAHINGGTAQADILGILGREGLDLATRWVTPETGTPAYLAFRMYRNYDGAKSAFGDVSVRATVPDPDEVSAFAATRTRDGALTIMVINKQLSSTATISLNVSNYAMRGNVQRWQQTAAGIQRLSDVSSLSALTLPPQSITLFVSGAGTSRRRAVR